MIPDALLERGVEIAGRRLAIEAQLYGNPRRNRTTG